MSTSAKGSLGATHRAQEVLNDMIDNSYDTSVIGTKKATTETRELMEVKDRLNQILEPSGIKPYDKSLSKAKNLQVSFDTNKPDQTLQAFVFFDNLFTERPKLNTKLEEQHPQITKIIKP